MLAFDHFQIDQNSVSALPSGAPSAIGMLSRQMGQAISGQPRKLALGVVGAEFRACSTQHMLHLTATGKTVHVVVPVTRGVVVVLPTESHRIDPGSALLLAERERADCTWLAGAVALIFHVPRAAVQAQNYAAGREPRRIGIGTYEFGCDDSRRGFGAGLAALATMMSFRFEGGSVGSAEAGGALIAGLAEELEQSPRRSRIFPAVTSAQRAIDHLRENPGNSSLGDLARAAGVTLPVLRRNVRDHTGMTLTKLLLDVRLNWIHGRLKSYEEARSISQLATMTGHSTPVVFGRAYQKRFGETPTQTRARAFAQR